MLDLEAVELLIKITKSTNVFLIVVGLIGLFLGIGVLLDYAVRPS